MSQSHVDETRPGSYLLGNRSEVRSGSHALVQFVQISGVGWLYLVLKVLSLLSDIS